MQNYSTNVTSRPQYEYSAEKWTEQWQRQWDNNWTNFISDYTNAILQAGVLQEVRDINEERLVNASLTFEKANNSSVTLFLSLAKTITNIASKVFKAIALAFGAIAITHTFSLPITLPQVVLSSFAAMQFFIVGSIFQLATKGLDKLKDQWVKSYFTPEEREEIENLRKFKQIQNLDSIASALKNVNNNYRNLLDTYGDQAIHKSRPEWNRKTIDTHQRLLQRVADYQAISRNLHYNRFF